MSGALIGGAPKVNDKVVQALAKVMADAKRGLVSAVAVIAVGEDGRPNVIFGGESDLTPSVNLGVDMLKSTMLQQILGSPQQGLIKPHQADGQ